MIQRINFKVDTPDREFMHFSVDQFPYICLQESLEHHRDKTISWHWHQCYEIVYVAEGALECHCPDQMIPLEKGEALFVNAGTLHRYRQTSRTPCVLYAHIFDASFLIGEMGSSIYQKYIFPISKSPGIQLQAIRPENHHQCLMLEHLQHMLTLSRQEPYGYEFQLQHHTSQLWCRLLTLTAERQAVVPGHTDCDVQRVKMMLGFIHQNYARHLTLKDIADSAAISERECSRCFQRCFQMSTIQYLHDYRIRTASRLLLESEKSVSQISQSCGFCTPSYFSRCFQEAFGCSPKEYRKNASVANAPNERIL